MITSRWETKALGEVADLCLGKMLDQKKNRGELMPYLANVNVRWGDFDLTNLRTMRFEERERDRYGLRSGDIVMCEGGEPGRCAIWKSQRPQMMIQKALHRIRPKECLDNSYLYYNLLLLGQRNGFDKFFTGATIKHLPGEQLAKVQVLVPPLHEQRRVASILSPYDDLISNNSRRLAVVEEIARRTYEEWFVNFRFPGHEQVRMVDSELGAIPKGWKLHRLGDIVEFAYGKALKSEDRVQGAYPVYGSSGIVGFHDQFLTGGPGIIVGRKGNVGSVHWCDSPFYPIDTVYFVRTKLPLHYLFFNLQRQNFLNNDAAVPGLNRNQAYSLPLLVPPDETLEQFQRLCSPMFELCRLLRQKNKNLTATRDLLLPRLIAGDLNVINLEQPEEAIPL